MPREVGRQGRAHTRDGGDRGAGRLARLVALGDPSVTFHAVVAGERPLAGVEDHVWEAWGSCAGLDAQVAERCDRTGVWVTWRGDGRYPQQLRDDPAAPAVVFCAGDAGALAVRRVGIVGTRRCTAAGARDATECGEHPGLRGARRRTGVDVALRARVVEAERDQHVVHVGDGGASVLQQVVRSLTHLERRRTRHRHHRCTAAGGLCDGDHGAAARP
ncbi:MAG: DNA-processing protein DprA [Actinomycetota bacterium]